MREEDRQIFRKNQELTLEITDMGKDGEGIGKVDGYTLFVKDALVGDVIRARILKMKKRYGYARLMEIITPSAWRVDPACPVARQCGGCQLQHCSYERQLEWKEKKVADCITRIGGIPVGESGIPMEPILRMENPYHYRNKGQFPVGYDKDGKLVTGFYAGHSHQIIPCTDCAIQNPCCRPILETIIQYMKEFGVTAYREEQQTGLVRHVLIRVGVRTGQIMVCLVVNGRGLPHQDELISRLLDCTIPDTDGQESKITSICLNRNQENTNVILGKEITVLYGTRYIEDMIGEVRFQISPLSFYQVNAEQTIKLYETAMEYADLKGGETVWDLYCGIGTISLFLAKKAGHVCGVEIVPEAVEDARNNAAINGIKNVEFFTGAAEKVVPEQYEKSRGALRADVVVLDPPRKGCDERLLETVIQMNPDRIVYVSCDPATLARDLKVLCGSGYELKRVRACDMFGWSGHVETVCLLHRRDS